MEGIGSAIGLIPIPGLKAIGKYGVEGAVTLGKKAKGWLGKGSTPKLVSACKCFTAGTKVLSDEGEKNIEDITVGDMVLAKDCVLKGLYSAFFEGKDQIDVIFYLPPDSLTLQAKVRDEQKVRELTYIFTLPEEQV